MSATQRGGLGRRSRPLVSARAIVGGLACVLALVVVGTGPLAAQDVEEILSYDVAINVLPGGAMQVTEQIQVRALGQQIRRGIFRDIPTSFPRWSGLGRIEAPLTVRSVLRDGQPERYTLEGIGGPIGRGGVRVRIGNANVLLDPGVHTYTIEYETDRWVRFGSEEDQLLWNVTGNGWGFTIRSASATVTIAELGGDPIIQSWTGPEGAVNSIASEFWIQDTRTAEFRTNGSLGPGEGLTIGITFPSGQLTPPSEAQREGWFQLDWGGYVDAGYLVLFVIGIYLLMWRRVGIDPAAGQVHLRREPPVGYSPAALGFIEDRGYRQSQLSAALVSMALKGAIRIKQDDGDWSVHKLDLPEGKTVPDGLSEEEAVLFRELLGNRHMIDFDRSRHETLRSAIKEFKRSLARRHEREYFRNNRKWFAAGLIVSIIGFVALAWRWRFGIEAPALFLGFWLTGWTAGVVTLLYRLLQQFKVARAGGGAGAWAGVVALALFSVPFVGAEVFVTGLLFAMTPSHLVLAAMAIGLTNVAFYHLLERPTLKGRGILDQLEGFRRYLGDEADRSLPAPDSQVALFERFLPFAIALGLEARWTEAFADTLRPMLAGPQGRRHLPWYHHDGGDFHPSGFASSLGSGLSSTLSANSAPPSSSGGGGGGGGFSGGGGGGGGGGGW